MVLFHADLYGPFAGGFVGVDLFFVLSGFLITSILAAEFQQTGTIKVGNFYWRRFMRLMPALLLFLAAYLIVAPFIWPAHPHGRDALLAATYVTDYSFALWRAPTYLSHTWSLAVEEHYYLLWPLLLPALLKAKRPLIWLALAWLAMTMWRTANHDSLMTYYRFDTRASGLIVGSAMYFVRWQASRGVALAGLVLFGAVVLTAKMDMTNLAVPVTELASALVILGAAHLGFLTHPTMVGAGKLSYGIYLWHFPIAIVASERLSFVPATLVVSLLSLALAAASYVTVERWSRRRRDVGSREAVA